MSGAAIALAIAAAAPQAAEPLPSPEPAESAPPPVAVPPARTERPAASRWYGRVGGVAALYHPGARVALGGRSVPDSSVDVTTDYTLVFDIGYDVGDRLSAQLTFGVPPRPSVTGTRAIAPLGALGEVRYGPVILTGLYRLPRLGPVRPYAGLGGAYVVVFKAYDGSIADLKVHNDWGFVLQAGAEVPVGRRIALFADVKRLWLSVGADGTVAGDVPVDARVRLDPTLVSAGLKVRFR
ncbi:MAG: OmpW family protein [Alphaproteobacteria bacterium]|nr:OmpW family protein [Alphaproteobacteria bacterium]MBV9372301.1 OmpW family protein [Alphaproteobacteria bacterium]MBV9899593.1 OmpW family protein [Alphaproteobacteria bacterium]